MPSKREPLIPFALVGFALVCYARIIPTYFISDDFVLIGNVMQEGMFTAWGTSHGGFLRPGTILSYVIDRRLYGLNPSGYHLTNIFFHGMSAYALFLLSRHYFKQVKSAEPQLAAFLTACLFIALPCHSESVSWIAGRTDIIATAFGLGATVCFLFLPEKRSLLHALLALALLAAALLTKESVIVLPLIWGAVFVQDWCARGRRLPLRSVTVLILSGLMLAGYFLLRKAIIGHYVGGYGTARHISIFQPSSLGNLLRFLLRTFLPALPLGLRGPYPPGGVIAAGFAVAAFGVGIIVYRRRLRAICWSPVALLVLCYFISLVPVITMPVNLFDTQNERFLYLPSAFACLLVVQLIKTGISHQQWRTFMIVTLIILQATFLQWVNKRWITASQLAEQIATEVSTADPATTVVLNVPDNFCGAYVFRNGLTEAATIFRGIRRQTSYRIISMHDMCSMKEVYKAGWADGAVTLALPDNVQFKFVNESIFNVARNGNRLSISDTPNTQGVSALLSFKTGAENPMLETIEWRSADNMPKP